jgi:hypothetical protein
MTLDEFNDEVCRSSSPAQSRWPALGSSGVGITAVEAGSMSIRRKSSGGRTRRNALSISEGFTRTETSPGRPWLPLCPWFPFDPGSPLRPRWGLSRTHRCLWLRGSEAFRERQRLYIELAMAAAASVEPPAPPAPPAPPEPPSPPAPPMDRASMRERSSFALITTSMGPPFPPGPPMPPGPPAPPTPPGPEDHPAPPIPPRPPSPPGPPAPPAPPAERTAMGASSMGRSTKRDRPCDSMTASAYRRL